MDTCSFFSLDFISEGLSIRRIHQLQTEINAAYGRQMSPWAEYKNNKMMGSWTLAG